MDHAVGSREAVYGLPFDLLVLAVKPSHSVAAADRAAFRLPTDFDLRKVILAVTGKCNLLLFLLLRHFIQRFYDTIALCHFLRELVDMAAGFAAGSHLEVVIVNIAADDILPVAVGIGHSYPPAVRQPKPLFIMLVREADPVLRLLHVSVQHVLTIAVAIYIRKILISFTRQAIPLTAHIGVAVKSTLRRHQLAVILDRHGAQIGLDFPIMGADPQAEQIGILVGIHTEAVLLLFPAHHRAAMRPAIASHILSVQERFFLERVQHRVHLADKLICFQMPGSIAPKGKEVIILKFPFKASDKAGAVGDIRRLRERI